MNESNALRLAKWLDAMPSSGYALTNQASAELRRLHEANQELLEALKSLVQVTSHLNPCPATLEQALAAIAKGEQA